MELEAPARGRSRAAGGAAGVVAALETFGLLET